jgi:hypothetical protein
MKPEHLESIVPRACWHAGHRTRRADYDRMGSSRCQNAIVVARKQPVAERKKWRC